MTRNLAALRSEVETALAGRVASPFTYRDRHIVETAPTGIPEIDSIIGGLPRGGLTEIYGPPCLGRTTLLISALASRTTQEEVCALVDGCDAFDPHSAQAAGVELEKLLWVRCHTVDQSLRAADLLIQGGAFGIVALDLSDFPPATTRYIPLNAWFHLRRAVEDTKTILIVLEQEPHAKTCASLVLRVGAQAAIWSSSLHATWEPPMADLSHPGSSCLLDGFSIHAEVIRSRLRYAKPFNIKNFPGGLTSAPQRENHLKTFGTKPPWSAMNRRPPEQHQKYTE